MTPFKSANKAFPCPSSEGQLWTPVQAEHFAFDVISPSMATKEQHEEIVRLVTAAPDLLNAARKTLAFLDDLSNSNPGYMSNLVLQDYKQWSEAMFELPAAIAKACPNLRSPAASGAA
jgi:hypothetical protein